MEKLQNMKNILTGSNYCTSLLSGLHKTEEHMDISLCSDGHIVLVHSGILSQCSEVMREVLDFSGTNLIILPGYSPILSDFVSLVYTGQTEYLTYKNKELLGSLCTELGLHNISIERIDLKNDEDDAAISIHRAVLKVQTDVFDESSQERFRLRLPISRYSQKHTIDDDYDYVFEDFQGRVQVEYNMSPVGPYEGPYDQNPCVPLRAQLPDSRLSYNDYTNFVHSNESRCKVFKIKHKYEEINDLEKIDALEVSDESIAVFSKPDNQEVFYTCRMKYCKIPCPCHMCCSNVKEQCFEHNIKHVDLFDEKEHLFSVRTTELSCSVRDFFSRSYVLKYPGIPKSCQRCRKDLLHHKSYHLDFHSNCKFCKFYQYKLYPKSTKGLHEREKEEKKWYKRVCPYCDKKFSEPFQAKRHIDCEHNKNSKIKCDECQKQFLSNQSLHYHKLVQHTVDVEKSHSCNICDQTFLAKVNLENHIKFKHSDVRKIECTKCDAKFKQKKNLNAHVLRVHGTNSRKEDYWQDLEKETFKCVHCGTIFARNTDLKVHISQKHAVQNVFQCTHCGKEYSYKKSLERHTLEKHGLVTRKFECPDCGKIFNQKRNIERHQYLHGKK